MKVEYKKKPPITIIIAVIVTAIFTFVFATLSIYRVDNWIFRILTQGGMFLNMLLSGVNCFVYQKQKVLGTFIWLVSGFILFVMVNTIYVGIQKNIF